MSFIEIKGLHKWYGSFPVFRGITENVEQGEALVICGRCVNRLEEYQKGMIHFDGRDTLARYQARCR